MKRLSFSRRTFATALLAALASPFAAGPLPAQRMLDLPVRDRVLQARLAPVFSVGKEDGAAWETFSNVRQVAFDGADNLYVLDRGSASIFVFGPNGRFLRQIGKKGGGPGELLSPMQFAVTREGTVVVSDLGRRAFSVFRVDGGFVKNVPFEGQSGLSGMRMHASPQGGVVMTAQALPVMSSASGGVTIVRQQFSGRAAPGRIFQAREEGSASTARPAAGGATVISSRRPAFSPEVNWGVLPDGGIAVAHTADYAVRIVTPAGAVTRVLRRPIAPRKVTEADREAERERFADQIAGGSNVTVIGGSGTRVQSIVREALASQVRDMRFAAVLPVIQEVAVDRTGLLWIARSGRQVGSPGPIDLVTSAGQYVGTLAGHRMPNAFSPTGRVAYIEKDDMEVERVVVRQLPPRW